MSHSLKQSNDSNKEVKIVYLTKIEENCWKLRRLFEIVELDPNGCEQLWSLNRVYRTSLWYVSFGIRDVFDIC